MMEQFITNDWDIDEMLLGDARGHLADLRHKRGRIEDRLKRSASRWHRRFLEARLHYNSEKISAVRQEASYVAGVPVEYI